MKVELLLLTWSEVLLKKYEGEKVHVASSADVPELVTLDED